VYASSVVANGSYPLESRSESRGAMPWYYPKVKS
jgi:hypothetical protein